MLIKFTDYKDAVEAGLVPLRARQNKLIEQLKDDPRHFLDNRLGSLSSLVAEIHVAECLVGLADAYRDEEGKFKVEDLERMMVSGLCGAAREASNGSYWYKHLSAAWSSGITVRMAAGFTELRSLINKEFQARAEERDRKAKWIVESYSGCWWMRRDFTRTRDRSKAGIFLYDERPAVDKTKWRYVKIIAEEAA